MMKENSLTKPQIMTIRFAIVFAAISVIAFSPFLARASDSVHLVLLTGDERMQNLDEEAAFLPLMKAGLDEENIIVVKVAYDRKHLGHWQDNWSASFRGQEIRDDAQGWILNELVNEARSTVGQKKVQSATLVFAQGITDTKEGYSISYEASFRELMNQLKTELGQKDLHCVIARLGLIDEASKKRHPEWNTVRTIQEQLGETLPHSCWVDTDAIVDRSKGYSEDLGKLLAEATLTQIHESTDSTSATLPAGKTQEKKQPAHLFLLSGQSNMANLNPEEAFVPAVVEAFGEDGAIVVKAAYGAKSIQHWYQTNLNGKERLAEKPDFRNWLYRELIGKTRFAIANREIKSVTLCWMQGEADSSTESSASAYAANFEGLLQLLREDLGRDDIHFVIGRLSDHSNPDKFPAWNQMRDTQVNIADNSLLGRWIDTDAFNGDDDNLHYPKGETGQVALARSFAAEAIELAHSTEK